LIGLGQLLDLNHRLLSSLMLSTTKIEAMCQIARDSGALGTKITGAGGGGCMFALAPDLDTADRIREALGREAFVAEVHA
jgi:mevalonate kinase